MTLQCTGHWTSFAILQHTEEYSCSESIFHFFFPKSLPPIGDSHQTSLLTVKLALLLTCPVYSGEKEKANRAYCSSFDWPESIFPNSSMELRVPKVCKKYKADQDTILGKCVNRILKFGPLILSFGQNTKYPDTK